jgi:hypothetical protein
MMSYFGDIINAASAYYGINAEANAKYLKNNLDKNLGDAT